jgi:hypothetical protein
VSNSNSLFISFLIYKNRDFSEKISPNNLFRPDVVRLMVFAADKPADAALL